MLARFIAYLPFQLTMPEHTHYTLHPYEDSGYLVCVLPPGQSERVDSRVNFDSVSINGIRAIQADVLRIDFSKDSFDRSPGETPDPPKAVIDRAVNSFLVRLRYVTRSPKIRSIFYREYPSHIAYLYDDETELEKREGLIRGRSTFSHTFGWIGLIPEVWEDVHALPIDFVPEPWNDILLDSSAELPSVGPAIVLAAAAVEVFASSILNKLAAHTRFSPDLWRWLTNRGNDPNRQPSSVEMLHSLLKHFTGHSLKEENALWERYQNLRNARNSFVHDGVAMIGKQKITNETAQDLIQAGHEVIAKVKTWLPDDLHWKDYKYPFQFHGTLKMRMETPPVNKSQT